MLFSFFLYICIYKYTAITANITCDNKCTIYADGKNLGEDNAHWYTASQFTFPQGTRVIGIHGIDVGGVAALMGSFSNGMLTDSKWKCSPTYFQEWSSESFNDSQWPAAVVYGTHFTSPWTRRIDHIASGAKWIWTADNGGDNNVYCRCKI